jgi:hypothetical protein
VSARIVRSPSNPAGGPEKPEKQGNTPFEAHPSRLHLVCPDVDKALITHLETMFPLTLCHSLDDYRRMEGHRAVIDYLTRQLREQNS